MLGIIDHFNIDGYVYIVTGRASGGDLVDYMDALGLAHLSEEHAAYIFTQMVIGLKDVHM